MSLKTCCIASSHKIIEWIFILALLAITFLCITNLDVHHQCIPGFDPHHPNSECGFPNLNSANPHFAYPMKESTIPTPIDVILGFLLWFFVLAINVAVMRYLNHSMDHKQFILIVLIKLEILFRSAVFSTVMNQLITTTLKVSVGRPRPNYLLNDDESDRIRSFPSGHTSGSFAIGFLTTLHLLRALFNARKYIHQSKAQMKPDVEIKNPPPENSFLIRTDDLVDDHDHQKVENKAQEEEEEEEEKRDSNLFMKKFTDPRNGDSYWGIALLVLLKHVQILWMVIALTPTLLAVYVGYTRITDYMHHVSDVLAGMLIGTGCAVLAFLYYDSEFYQGFEYDADGEEEVKEQVILQVG